jgi:hypothetical protein
MFAEWHDIRSLPRNSQMGCKVRTVQAEINLRPSIKYDSQGALKELKFNRIFVKNSNTEFHENMSNGLFADTTSERGRRTDRWADRRGP